MTTVERKLSDAILGMVGLAATMDKGRRKKFERLSKERLAAINVELADIRDYSHSLRKRIEDTKEFASEGENPPLTPEVFSVVERPQLQNELEAVSDEVGRRLADILATSWAPSDQWQQVISSYTSRSLRQLVFHDANQLLRAWRTVHMPSSSCLAGSMLLFEVIRSHRALEPERLLNFARVSVLESMDSLVKLEVMARAWKASHIVTVNPGGRLVGSYLAARLGIAASVATFDSKTREFLFEEDRLPRSRAKVLIVDDISRSGETLRGVHQELSNYRRSNEYQCMTLVAATTSGPIDLYSYSPRVTNDTTVTLPWETHGELVVEKDVYKLGSGNHTIAIAKSQADQMRNDVEEREKL